VKLIKSTFVFIFAAASQVVFGAEDSTTNDIDDIAELLRKLRDPAEQFMNVRSAPGYVPHYLDKLEDYESCVLQKEKGEKDPSASLKNLGKGRFDACPKEKEALLAYMDADDKLRLAAYERWAKGQDDEAEAALKKEEEEIERHNEFARKTETKLLDGYEEGVKQLVEALINMTKEDGELLAAGKPPKSFDGDLLKYSPYIDSETIRKYFSD
jgi:hypothetical protein